MSVLGHFHSARHLPMWQLWHVPDKQQYTLLWLFRWPPTTKQFTASLTGGNFAARPKSSSGVFPLSWCVQSSYFFSAALIPSIETRSKPTRHRHGPWWLSDFPQGILTKGTARQELFISKMFYATQPPISITHSKFQDFSLNCTTNSRASAQLRLWELSQHNHYRVPEPQKWGQQDSQRKLLSAVRFSSRAKPNFQLLKQTRSYTLQSQPAWFCHCVGLTSCAGIVTMPFVGKVSEHIPVQHP